MADKENPRNQSRLSRDQAESAAKGKGCLAAPLTVPSACRLYFCCALCPNSFVSFTALVRHFNKRHKTFTATERERDELQRIYVAKMIEIMQPFDTAGKDTATIKAKVDLQRAERDRIERLLTLLH